MWQWMQREQLFVSALKYISYTAVVKQSFRHVQKKYIHAKEEGIIFDLLTNPKEILVDENDAVAGIRASAWSSVSRMHPEEDVR